MLALGLVWKDFIQRHRLKNIAEKNSAAENSRIFVKIVFEQTLNSPQKVDIQHQNCKEESSNPPNIGIEIEKCKILNWTHHEDDKEDEEKSSGKWLKYCLHSELWIDS